MYVIAYQKAQKYENALTWNLATSNNSFFKKVVNNIHRTLSTKLLNPCHAEKKTKLPMKHKIFLNFLFLLRSVL